MFQNAHSPSIDPLFGQPVPELCKDHIVQFYESTAYLSKAVGQYASAGLEHGEAVIIIAREAHAEAFRRVLTAQGHDVAQGTRSGQLVFLDAQETLATFMVNGSPDWEKYLASVGALIERTRLQFKNIRAYGEMVDILRAEQNLEAMNLLETYWNDLAGIYSFSLLCGYGIGGFSSENRAQAFDQVCRVHSHVFPAENIPPVEDMDSRNRSIALLQRRAAALEAEIADRKRAEASLKEAIRVRDEFLSIASHELKTPITSLKLQTQMFQRRFDKNDPALSDRKHLGKLVETTSRQVDRLDRLVDDMLDISRISHGKLHIEIEEVDLSEIVRDVVDRFTEQMKSIGCRHRLILESSIVGYWDRYRLEQVVTNLITNAMKYAPGRPIEISVTAEEGLAILKVKDQGDGISQENLVRIFHRFERAISAENVSGLGLGLYISHQIIEAHKGKIWAESEIGKGSTFVVSLPLSMN
jgi:signal transduction histidine kinase